VERHSSSLYVSFFLLKRWLRRIDLEIHCYLYHKKEEDWFGTFNPITNLYFIPQLAAVGISHGATLNVRVL
jgi:hypothetical protein